MKLIPRKKQEDKPVATDIWQIMDYKKPFQIFYSGVEPEDFFNTLCECGIKTFLMSYHYIQSKHINMKERFANKGIKLIVDSGAHTYMNNEGYDTLPIEEWETKLKSYLNWAEKYKEYIFALANFDFEDLVDDPAVIDKWNREYFEPFMLRTGIPVCFVWHQNSYRGWEYYCKRYPYVSISAANSNGELLSVNDFKDYIKTAEKYGSLVHGMGMTQTSMLTELPFYTVDSTTWQVGMRYGEMNYWNGAKVIRLKKTKWKGDMLDNIVDRYHLDKEKLLDEDLAEMNKANAYAFIEAVEFIQHHLKKRMYWLKAKAVKYNLDFLPPDFFPPQDWIIANRDSQQDSEKIREYAQKMNINPEIIKDAYLSIRDMTTFLNWDNDDYSECKTFILNDETLLQELHDFYINKVRQTDDERIEDLKKFFKECLEGTNEFLLHLGTNFDRRQLEREEYIEEDEEYDLVDVPKSEVINAFRSLLPTKSDEEDEEKDVDFENIDPKFYDHLGVVPVFDDNGNFVTYKKKVGRAKQIYSKKFPKFACDNCFVGAKCPEYKAGYVCAYNKIFKKFDTRNMRDIIEAVQSIIGFGTERLQRAMIFEQLSGGTDPVVTTLMDNTIKNLMMLKDLYTYSSTEVLRQTKVIRSDGTTENTIQVSNPQEGGVLAKLFGDLSQKEESKEEPETIDVDEKA